jgi:hypothetical protein
VSAATRDYSIAEDVERQDVFLGAGKFDGADASPRSTVVVGRFKVSL